MCKLTGFRLSRTSADWFVGSPLDQGDRHLLVHHRDSRADEDGRATLAALIRRYPMKTPTPKTSFGTLLQQFFMERLIQQKHASACTVATYRDSFQLLLGFAERRLHKRPTELRLIDLDVALILRFLEHLEKERHNSIRTRNARFIAIRSFMQYAALKEPSALGLIQSVLAIPMKRFERPLVGFLPQPQVQAILEAPPQSTWSGQRDRVMLTTLYNTGARVSELTGMRVCDVMLTSTAAIRIHGKEPQGPNRASVAWHGESDPRLASSLSSRSGSAVIPQSSGCEDDSRWRHRTAPSRRPARRGSISGTGSSQSLSPYPAALTRHATAAVWSGYHRDRLVVGS